MEFMDLHFVFRQSKVKHALKISNFYTSWIISIKSISLQK